MATQAEEIKVTCDTCKAMAGDPCVTAGSKIPMRNFHLNRKNKIKWKKIKQSNLHDLLRRGF